MAVAVVLEVVVLDVALLLLLLLLEKLSSLSCCLALQMQMAKPFIRIIESNKQYAIAAIS